MVYLYFWLYLTDCIVVTITQICSGERTEMESYTYTFNLEDEEGNRTATVTFSPATILLYIISTLVFALFDVDISARNLVLAQILNG